MPTEFIDETTVFEKFSEAIKEGRQEILIASPWITKAGLNNIFDDLNNNARILRILIKIKEQQDADINDLDTLHILKLNGARIRISPPLHAKVLIVDNCKVIIGSSNITATGLGINNAPNFECGVISDEFHLVDQARRKYEQIWQNAVDYEHGDLRIEDNKIYFSETGNKKMTGSLLSELGGGKLFHTLTQPKFRESKALFDIKIPDPLGIRSKIKGKAKEVISPLTDDDFKRLQKSYWENVSQSFLFEIIQTNKEFVKETLKPSNSIALIMDPSHALKIDQASSFSSENAKIINKYKDETYKFVNENTDIVQRLRTKGIGKNTISYIESLNLPEDKKVHYLIILGLIIMASPSIVVGLPLPPMGQRVGSLVFWPFFAALGLVLISEGIMKSEQAKNQPINTYSPSY